MKISDCLLTLVKITGGIAIYDIMHYLGRLVELGYLEIDGDKYVLKKKEQDGNG